MTAQRDPVDEQHRAYNAHDVEAFVASYAPDAVLEEANGRAVASGREAIRRRYGDLFRRFPTVQSSITMRIRIGKYTIDEETVTGDGLPETRGVAVYTCEKDLITNVRFLRG
jgi:uncharacterized protein (TIGR02246 family)